MDFRFSISDFRFWRPQNGENPPYSWKNIGNRESKIQQCVLLALVIFSLSISTIMAQESGRTAASDYPRSDQGLETGRANPFVIKSIEIQGSKTMPAETVLGILQTRVGEEVSLKQIRDDVKELFKLGQFSNIQVDSRSGKEQRAESKEQEEETLSSMPYAPGSEGIHLTFILEEYPKVKDVSLNGNRELNDGKIKDVLTIGPGRSLSGKLLHENENKIVSLYRKKGYYLVEVESDALTDPEDESVVNVTFNINEGRKIEVEEIDIIGNRRISDREIKKQMKIKKGKRFDDDYFEGDLKTVAEYYRQKGFIKADIISSGKEFNEDKTGLIVSIEVEEGPQFRVGQLQAYIQPHEDSEPLFTEREILKQFTLKEGDIFSEAAFDEGIAKVSKMYFDKGRVSVQIKPDRDLNYEEEILDLKLTVFEGGAAYIDDVPINWVSQTSDEPHKTKEYVIRRELNRFDIKKGELFSSQNIEDARRKILTLGPFIRRAQPRPRLSLGSDSEDGGQRVTVNFDLEESRQSGMFSIAGGYGSEGGVFGALDIWDDNILGRAWRLHIRGEIGTRERRTGQIYFSTPWIFNSPTSLGLSLYSRRRSTRYYPGEEDEEALYRDENVGASVTVGRPLTRQIDLSVGFRNEKASSYERFLDDEWEKIYSGNIRSVKLSIDRDTRQFITSMFDPSSGSYNTFSVEYSGLGGDKFQKYMTESSLFIPTWWKLVLVFHLRTGYLGGEDIGLMRYERFFLGGIDSVRGYDLYSITPPGGPNRYYERYGGNQMALLNVEYRFPITDMLRGLIFLDAGQAWADNEWPWDNFKPRKSVGIGLRIDLLGALARLEYGFPLDEAREGEGIKGGKIQFDIGPAF